MKHFSHRFEVNASIEAVAAFHSDTRALKRLTPPPIIVQFHQIEPLAEGSRSEFTLWLGPLPIRWLARHADVDPLTGFSDMQEAGPFEHWEHRHSFEAIDEGRTTVIDELRVLPGKHPLWGLVSWGMFLNLPILFAYRAWATRRALS